MSKVGYSKVGYNRDNTVDRYYPAFEVLPMPSPGDRVRVTREARTGSCLHLGKFGFLVRRRGSVGLIRFDDGTQSNVEYKQLDWGARLQRPETQAESENSLLKWATLPEPTNANSV